MNTVVKALIFDSLNNTLTLKRSETHPRYAHEADLPGGEVEYNEGVVSALIREIREETGLSVHAHDLKLAHERLSKNKIIHQVYECHIEQVAPPVKLSSEHESYAWITSNDTLGSLKTNDEYMIVAREWLTLHR